MCVHVYLHFLFATWNRVKVNKIKYVNKYVGLKSLKKEYVEQISLIKLNDKQVLTNRSKLLFII